MKTKAFIRLSVCGFFSLAAGAYFLTAYKSFGEKFIDND
jgi:hypothetical protein